MAFLPLVIAFAFLLSVLITLARSNGELVRQTNAKCPAKVGTDPSLACQVQQLHDLLGKLDVEPVPGQPGVVRIVVPSPYVVVMTPRPAPTAGGHVSAAPRQSSSRPSPRPSPRPSSSKPTPKPSPSPTCSTAYNPLSGKCLT